jgi:hypothetical protein
VRARSFQREVCVVAEGGESIYVKIVMDEARVSSLALLLSKRQDVVGLRQSEHEKWNTCDVSCQVPVLGIEVI